MPRLPTAPMIVAALLVATPSLLTAQRIAPPSSSSVWQAGSGAATADSSRRKPSNGWTQSTAAAAGGVVGVLAGLAVGLWRCRHREVDTGRICGRDVPRAAALLGGLGLLVGLTAGTDAKQH
jgi:hypothetical protein